MQRVLGERRLRARAQHARVVDEQVDVLARGTHERAPVVGIGDVAGDRGDLGERPELAGRLLEILGVPRASSTSAQCRLASVRASASPRPREAPVMIAVGMAPKLGAAAVPVCSGNWS